MNLHTHELAQYSTLGEQQSIFYEENGEIEESTQLRKIARPGTIKLAQSRNFMM